MMTLPQGNGEGQGSWAPGLGDRKLSGVHGIVGASSALPLCPALRADHVLDLREFKRKRHTWRAAGSHGCLGGFK